MIILTLKELMDNYGKLESLENEFARISGSKEIPDIVKKHIPPVSQKPDWNEESKLLRMLLVK